jgi:ribosomal protein S18 acetylase RimI-like enzyme
VAGADIGAAEAGDRERVAAALTAAFMDDPVTEWAVPAAGHRPGVIRHFFRCYFDFHQGEGTIFVDRERRGAAVWALPGNWRTSVAQDLKVSRSFAHPRHWRRAAVVATGLLGLERRHPPAPPHFYLASLGVEPAAQGRGLGSRLLQPVLEICDSDGIPAYLESSKRSNIAFYARHGFRVTGELRLSRRGPTMWPMWREPLGA